MSLAGKATASPSPSYERHQPEETLLFQLIQQHYPAFKASLKAQGHNLPRYIQLEFEDFLQCGRLEYGFLRVRCEDCHHERLVAFRCKRRGFCPSCGARRMAQSAALLLDEVFPKVPIRQWVLSFPFQLRFLLSLHPELMGQVLGIVYRSISTHLTKKAGYTKATAQTGSVTLIQRFGSAPNLNPNAARSIFICCFSTVSTSKTTMVSSVSTETHNELNTLVHTLSHRITRCLEKRCVLPRDAENTWLTLEEEENDVLPQLQDVRGPIALPLVPSRGAGSSPFKS